MDVSSQHGIIDSLRKRKGTEEYSTTASVTRIDGADIYVRIPGSETETCVENSSAAVSVGDTVDLLVSNYDTHITGNRTAPATDDTKANQAAGTAKSAQRAAEYAKREAETAHSAANSAIADAARAQEAANSAQADANTAKQAADSAVQDAADAKASATEAAGAAGEAKAEAASASKSAASAGVSAARAQAALDTMGDYDWDAETFNPNGSLFYKDELGAHIVDARGENGTYRTDIDSSGMTVTEIQSGDAVAKFGTEVQVGKDSGGNFVVKPDRLQGFSGDDKYFEVSADSLSFGANLGKKVATKDDVDSILIFDTDYDIVGGNGNPKQAEFHAHVYRSGVEVTDEFPADYFRWYIKNEGYAADVEGGNSDSLPYANGKTCTVTVDEGYIGYGATIVGVFEPVDLVGLLSVEGEEILTSDGDGIMVLAAGAQDGYIRITDLSEAIPKATDNLLGWSDYTYRSQVQNYMDLARADVEEKSELTAAQVAALLTI